MPRSTTCAATDRPQLIATDRRRLGLLLVAELVVAVILLAQPSPLTHGTPAPSAYQPSPAASRPSTALQLADGRRVELLGLGGEHTASLLGRIGAEIESAAATVTDFWGTDWPRTIVVVATGSAQQFQALSRAPGARPALAPQLGPDIAAVTTERRIVFAPGAATMSANALRIVVRHELFHYATRPVTAPDAPRWLTEGVADFVGRGLAAPPNSADAGIPDRLPTDADLDTPGDARSLAYDRAWWFSSYVADRYGVAALRQLYLRACGIGHSDLPAAVTEALGADLDEVLTGWRDWRAG